MASSRQGFISILHNNLEVGGEGSCWSDPQVLCSLCWREVPPLASSFLWFISSFHLPGHLLVQADCSRAAHHTCIPAIKKDGWRCGKGQMLPLLKEASWSSYTTVTPIPLLGLATWPHLAVYSAVRCPAKRKHCGRSGEHAGDHAWSCR